MPMKETRFVEKVIAFALNQVNLLKSLPEGFSELGNYDAKFYTFRLLGSFKC